MGKFISISEDRCILFHGNKNESKRAEAKLGDNISGYYEGYRELFLGKCIVYMWFIFSLSLILSILQYRSFF